MKKNNLCEGWLVASDIDGTINNKFRFMPKKNRKAIEKFVNDGGHFTLASGRNPQEMETIYNKLPIKGTPAVVINGAGIYDFRKREMIDFSPMSEKAMNSAVEGANSLPEVGIMVVAKNRLYISDNSLFNKIFVKFERLDHVFFKNINEVPKENWGKVVFSGLPSRISKIKKHFESLNDSDLTTMSSSVASFEILASNTDKGTAIMKVAEMLGIEKSKVGAIGDYYNDLGMLKSVGVPACCGQAPRDIKGISEFVACHCNKGAVADFIGYIRKKAETNY